MRTCYGLGLMMALAWGWLLASSGSVVGAADEAELRVERTEQGMVLENRFLRVRIDSLGGKIISFYDKRSDREFAGHPGKPGEAGESYNQHWRGFAKDRVWERKGQNEMIESTYGLSITAQTRDQVTLEARAEGSTGILEGLAFVKRYTLDRNRSALDVTYRVKSDGVWAQMSPWTHNLLQLPDSLASREATSLYAQTQDGLFVQPVLSDGSTNNLLFNLREPWLAMADRDAETGLLLGVDRVQSLSRFFMWAGNASFVTMEAVFRQANLSPDGSFTSEITYMPFHGLAAVHLATGDYAAGFQKRDGQAVLAIFPAHDLGETTVTVEREDKVVGQKTVDLRAGQTVYVPAQVPDMLVDVKVTFAHEKDTRTHAVRAAAGEVVSEVEAAHDLLAEPDDQPEMVYSSNVKDTLYVSPNMPTVTVFGLRHTQDEPGDVELVIEVPEGVEVILYHRPGRPRQLEHTTIEREGEPRQRYVIRGALRNGSHWAELFLTTDWRAGQTGEASFYTRWDDGREAAHRVAVEAIAIEPAPMPKRLITNLNWHSIELTEQWPDYFANMKKLGVNTVTSSMYDLLAAVRDDAGAKQLRDTIAKAQADGMYFAGNYSPFLVGQHREDVRQDDAVAISIDGEPDKHSLICPSYRGSAYQGEVERISAYGDFGVSILWYDPEIWKGASFCFCERCLERFEQFKDERYSSLPDISPRQFERNPLDHPELHQAWLEFRVTLGTEMFNILRDRYDQKLQAQSSRTSPRVIVGSYGMTPGRIYHQFLRFDEQYASGALNICMPSLYAGGNALDVAKTVRRIRQFTDKPNIIPWLSAGYGTRSSECNSIDVKYMVLENFLNGASGFTFYTWYGLDGLDMKYLAEAMRMIVPVEDVVMDGRPIDVSSSNPLVRTVSLRTDSEAIVLVAEYRTDRELTATLDLPDDLAGQVVDMHTREVVGQLEQGGTLPVAIDEHRTRLLYIGDRSF